MEVVCIDRDRLVIDVMSIMAETKTKVTGMHAMVNRKDKTSSIFLKLEVKSMEQFEYLKQRVRRVNNVLDVRRLVNRRTQAEKGEEA